MRFLLSSNLQNRIDSLYHPLLVWLFRLLVGAVFILSGFTKSVDPWGSFYKIGEYLEVWGWNIPSSLVVIAAFLLGGIEFVMGFLLLLGCYRRVAVWILAAMMLFMLPLTFYIAIADPVADCGCFGDFIVISNTATFIKNVVLTVMLIYLLAFNRRNGGLFVPYVQWVIGALLTLYILIVSLYGYNIQPLIDFRRFGPDTALLGETVEKDGDDEPVYEFIYEKNGKREEFTLDNLPDSTWTFIDRNMVSGSETIADGFAVIQDGEDIAPEIIDTETEQFVVTIPDMRKVDLSYTYMLNELNSFVTARGGSLVALVNGDDSEIEWWRDVSMASYPIYSVEPTLIKELARGRAAVVFLQEGVVKWKRTLSSISYTFLTETPYANIIVDLDPRCGYVLNTVTLIFLGILIAILILDRSGKLVAWLIKRRSKERKPS